MKKAILYINQFFAGIGGEEKADHAPEIREGVVGPGLALKSHLGKDVQITHTIICGDNYMGSHTDEAITEILSLLSNEEFDIFFAGPAFRAGRYGAACGHICKAVQDNFNVTAITSMNDENPGVEMFRKELYIFKGAASAAGMRKDTKSMARFALKVLGNEHLLSAMEEGYYSRGIRRQVVTNPPVLAADRVVDMFINKLYNKPFETELEIPEIDRVPIAPPINKLGDATIALITSGGIVPVDNPDRIQSASATRWGRYSVEGIDKLLAGEYKTIHAGFDPTAANNDPNIIMPIDVMKSYESEGVIGKLHEYFYATVGTGTTQAEASRMGQEMLEKLKEANVDGVILTST